MHPRAGRAFLHDGTISAQRRDRGRDRPFPIIAPRPHPRRALVAVSKSGDLFDMFDQAGQHQAVLIHGAEDSLCRTRSPPASPPDCALREGGPQRHRHGQPIRLPTVKMTASASAARWTWISLQAFPDDQTRLHVLRPRRHTTPDSRTCRAGCDCPTLRPPPRWVAAWGTDQAPIAGKRQN